MNIADLFTSVIIGLDSDGVKHDPSVPQTVASTLNSGHVLVQLTQKDADFIRDLRLAIDNLHTDRSANKPTMSKLHIFIENVN